MPSSNHLRFVLPRQIVSGFCHEATQLYANKFILSNTCTYSNIINLRFISRKVLEQFNLWHSRSNKNPDHSHEIVNDWRGKCSFHFLWFLLHSNSDKSGIVHLNSGLLFKIIFKKAKNWVLFNPFPTWIYTKTFGHYKNNFE